MIWEFFNLKVFLGYFQDKKGKNIKDVIKVVVVLEYVFMYRQNALAIFQDEVFSCV